ncbi:MAG TPA: hypothetical protein VGD02_05275 [Gemmatimonadaceae bacterium]|jgi:hypothetical protein
MSDDEDTSPLLPGELEGALSKAMASAVGSLDQLRKTLRRHVNGRKNRGASLPSIDHELQALVARIEERASQLGDGDGGLDGDLVAQIMKWNKAFFAGSDA